MSKLELSKAIEKYKTPEGYNNKRCIKSQKLIQKMNEIT